MNFFKFFPLFFVLILYTLGVFSKVDQSVQKSMKIKGRLNILVSFASTKLILSNFNLKFKKFGHADFSNSAFHMLNEHAKRTQTSALSILTSPKFSHQSFVSFWITNQIYVRGTDKSLIEELSKLDEVQNIHEEIIIRLDDPIPSSASLGAQLEWGIEKIQAKEAWDVGRSGSGAVVGVIDTGARVTHEAIRENFRGGEHSWYDPQGLTSESNDGNGHGTHVTGTIVGMLGIGVAPGAKWISCKGLSDFGGGTEASLIACGQFMACPHDYLGNKPNCSLAPHVVSNSWGSRGPATYFDPVIDYFHAVNIIPIFSAGNRGPNCERIGYPAGSGSSVITAAATDSTDALAGFSSRGPSLQAGELKPDVSAPGYLIRSAGIADDSSYQIFSGTSMAAPHVAGLVALLKSNDPDVNYDTIRKILGSTSSRNLTFTSATCGGISESEFPNYAFGYGRIDTMAAVTEIVSTK